MKSIIYKLFWLLLLILPSLSYAVPPYLGISVGQDLSFKKTSCLQAAKGVLQQHGFQKIVQSSSGTSFAAAYQKNYHYQYKALVKCLPTERMIIVVTAADSMKSLKIKAEYIRQQIQHQIRTRKYTSKHFKSLEYLKTSPYFGISVGKTAFTSGRACLQAAHNTLKKDGFEKITPPSNRSTLFAAYRNRNPYHYKALVKCVPKAKLAIVVTVANSKMHVKTKAEGLLKKIRRNAHPPQKINKDPDGKPNKPNLEPPKPKNQSEFKPEKSEDKQVFISEAWEHTILDQSSCLTQAQSAVQKTGFLQNLEFNEHSAKGINKNKYIGLIRCVTDEEFVFFWIKGENVEIREQLLQKLQQHF